MSHSHETGFKQFLLFSELGTIIVTVRMDSLEIIAKLIGMNAGQGLVSMEQLVLIKLQTLIAHVHLDSVVSLLTTAQVTGIESPIQPSTRIQK